jgi:hypothetical protein
MMRPQRLSFIMPGLVPGIDDLPTRQTWMAGTMRSNVSK